MLSIGLGSISFGYASGVIGPAIGNYSVKLVTPFGLVLTPFLAQPSFITYFDLATRSDTTSLISCMNVRDI